MTSMTFVIYISKGWENTNAWNCTFWARILSRQRQSSQQTLLVGIWISYIGIVTSNLKFIVWHLRNGSWGLSSSIESLILLWLIPLSAWQGEEHWASNMMDCAQGTGRGDSVKGKVVYSSLEFVHILAQTNCSTIWSPWLWTATNYLRWKMVHFLG